jgi:hypothetical protein
MLQRSAVDRTVQSDHILLAHQCPETLPVGTKGHKGRAIPQAVSRWFPTAATRVGSRVWSSGTCGGQNGAGAGFLLVLRFPMSIFIPPIAPQSPSPIIWGWYNRLEVAAVQGTQSHPTSNK